MRTEIMSQRNNLRRRAASIALAAALGIVATTPMAAIIDSGPISLAIPSTTAGVYINFLANTNGISGGAVPGWDFNPYQTGTGLGFYWCSTPTVLVCGGVVASVGGPYAILAPGDVISAASIFSRTILATANFKAGGTNLILGFRMYNDVTATVNYGYLVMDTTAGAGTMAGFPATIKRYVYDNTGAAIVVAPAGPILLGVFSRKVHGLAGTFDLPLTTTTPPAIDLNPVTEPRQGPTYVLAFKYDRPIASASLTPIEGTFGGASGITPGNEVVWTITGVPDQQYLAFTMGSVVAGDGSIGANISVRVGMLAGDVNQNRVVSLADVGQVNGQLAQAVTGSNYLKDINASGTLTLTDKAITNASLTHSLPAP